MDLLDKNRSLIYTGKLLRQPDNFLDRSGLTELFVLLFDNCREWNHNSMNAQTRKLEFSDSYYDETKRRGWRHEVSCIQKGKVHCFTARRITSQLAI
jgi:RHO1 GDP-GTP exchange protein 1/2